MNERKGVFTVKGSAVTLAGNEIKTGDIAPNFTVLDKDLNPVNSEKFSDKIKVIASVPSLDTAVCDIEIKRFNDEAARLPKGIMVMFISMDLPFAQKRFCHDNDIKNVQTFSDHRDVDFGLKFGALIKELRLLARAVFIIDQRQSVRYVEYVKELSSSPDYASALEALKNILNTDEKQA